MRTHARGVVRGLELLPGGPRLAQHGQAELRVAFGEMDGARRGPTRHGERCLKLDGDLGQLISGAQSA